MPTDDSANQKFNAYFDEISSITGSYARNGFNRYPGLRSLMTEDDVRQELQIACASAIERYDENRPVQNFLSATIRRAFTKLVRDTFRRKRMPRMVVSEDGIERQIISVPVSNKFGSDFDRESDESIYRPARADRVLIREQEGRLAISHVRRHISIEQQKVLDCLTDPPAALFVVARNVSGKPKITPSHIALFLKIPIARVSYAIKRIQKAAKALADSVEGNDDLESDDV